ncbi:ABC transporter, ATP-binding protein [Actinomyces sp. ICM54]|uniref:ATP-binding cassette domain-containing protein n=1 Tax=Actinomyces sp. ICM54 TaxID=936549 RepID=UPI00044A1680|nr:ATP-binding cassette domain-containing protein [Actinomyces sp. ICM54]EWC97021.1 ABC transporter, ATP-binding protein [Actinomyces sp. ICM54]
MSNDPRENLHGSDSQELADVTADAARTGAERAASTPAHTSDEAPAPRSALSSFEEILSGATHEADAPTTDTPAETLADDGAQDLQETLVSSTPLVTTDEAEATPAALTTDAATAAQTTAETASDIAPETATPQAAPQQPSQELTPANSANTTGNSAATNANNAVAAPVHLPPAEPRPWYRSRRSFSAKGRGGRIQVAGLGITYTDHVTGAVLLADIDLGFRARSLSAILDPTGRRARALFLILAGLEEPQAGRIVAAPSRSLAARLAGRIGSVALIRADSPLDESLTIRQNILAPLSATGSVADWDNLVGALQITGLAQRVDLRPSELSEWERFKALIARAIVSGAEVFLIEDPVSLPAAAREELGPLLRSLADAGCAVVIATPNAEVAAASDRAILLTNGRVALDAPNPSAAVIAASLEANPEDPKALLGPISSALPASFDEVISPTGSSSAPAWHPLGTADEAGAQTSDAQQAPEPEEAAEAALDAATTRVEAAPAQATQATEVPQASPEPRTETAMRGIPVVEAEDPALAEPEVSDLVVRARKILSDLPGSIAPQE